MQGLIGQTLERYQIKSVLGTTGTGTLFRAHDPALQRDVAIMVMEPHMARLPDFHERFLQEARRAARLDHPGIVKVFDFGQHDSLLYIVMEFIPGQNLRQLLTTLRAANEWIELPEAVRLVEQVCQAVDYIHREGVLHRNLRPDNIMLKPKPGNGHSFQPVLTDLGLATLDEGGLTPRENTPPGTLAYLSPEQVRGDATDARSDIYSLGILLYELAVGRLPFPIESLTDAIHFHTQEVPPKPRAINPALPEQLESVILKALEKNPAHRFAEAGEMAQALGQVLPLVTAAPSRPSGPTPEHEHGLKSGRPPTSDALATSGEAPIDPSLIYSSPGEGRTGLFAEMSQFSVSPGKSATTSIVVFNQGQTPDHFMVSVEGVPASWLEALPPAISLPPGQHERVRLTLKPPRSPQSRAGRYALVIRATSEAAPDQIAELKVTVTVTAYTQFSSEIAPQTVDVGQSTRVTVQNQGNTQETFTVTCDCAGDEVGLEPPETQLTIAEGQAAAAEFRASQRVPRWVGGIQAYPFSIQVSAPPNGESQTHTGEVLSRASVPAWALPLAIFLCAVLVGAVLLLTGESGAQGGQATQTAAAQQIAVVVAANATALRQTASVFASQTAVVSQTAGALATQTGAAFQTAAAQATLTADSDGDGIPDVEESRLGTNPTRADTDGDGLSDGEESIWGTKPQVVDSDGDTLPDGREVHELMTSPINPDTDGDGLNDNVDPDPTHLPTPTPMIASPMPAPSTPTLALPTSTPSLTPTPPRPGGERIAFHSDRDGNSEIYLMNADGTAQTRLTYHPASDTDPAWSPDGTRLVFVSTRDGNSEIYVMNADGSGQARLTNNTASDSDPVWSPDGTRLAFASTRDGNLEIYAMNADGSGQTRLTNDPEIDQSPTWSPDGRRLAFMSARDGNPEVYVMNADGSSQARLTSNPADDFDPAWSPDGARLAFVSTRDGNMEIYVMNADGSGQIRLTSSPASDFDPTWSPDASRMAFVSDRDGEAEIYVMNAADPYGPGLAQLTNNAADDLKPAWQWRR